MYIHIHTNIHINIYIYIYIGIPYWLFPIGYSLRGFAEEIAQGFGLAGGRTQGEAGRRQRGGSPLPQQLDGGVKI